MKQRYQRQMEHRPTDCGWPFHRRGPRAYMQSKEEAN